MAELPDLGDIHAQAAEGLADIADDAGTIFDDETNVERTIDFIFGCSQGARWNQTWRAGKLRRVARANSRTSPSTATAVGPPPAPGPTST